jgi:hypothetical protein
MFFFGATVGSTTLLDFDKNVGLVPYPLSF